MKRWSIAAALVAGAVLTLELVLRATSYATPDLHQLDPQLGWSLRAHKQGWYAGESGRTRVAINPAGFRDREHLLDKPDPVFRIAVLGDEYSEAMSIALRDTWWWRLEPQLQHCDFRAGKLIEVLNFGVAGYGTAQELVLLQTQVMRYQPDLVLLEFAPDDVIDNSFALTPHKLRPFYFLDAHGVPRIDESFADAPSFEQRMQTRYRLAAEIADHARALQLVREFARLTFIPPAHAAADEALFSAPRDGLHEDAWRTTEALIGKMDDFTRRNGAKLGVVVVPAPGQLAHGIGYPEERLGTLGKKLGVEVITLAPAMQRAFYRADGEWNGAGHRAAADAIAKELCGGQF